ncbi:MAG: hypothetical protein HY698_11885 [Deltaproteobacteria bacterium]|nr:hypothetical protein [Deltaproteobacteria bacterium]
MGKGFASLADKLADKKVPCRVRGCPRAWTWRSSDQVKAFSGGNKGGDPLSPPARMCELCHARYQTLEERALPCSSHGCSGTVTWTKLSQIEAILKHQGDGEPPPPRMMCDSCRGKARELSEREVPCRVRGCTNTWTWTGRAQLAAGIEPGSEAAAPSRMCDSCNHAYRALEDTKLPCKVSGCTRSFTWSRWQRLEAQVAGKKEPPERMCDECARALALLKDMEVPCRTDGCGETWIWKRGQQLEMLAKGEVQAPAASPTAATAATAPQRMCPDCQSKYSKLKDLQVPCKRTGCTSAWTFKRGAQLERWIKHGEHPDAPPPQRLCEGCKKRLDEFKDREVPCKNEGCANTWTWTRFAQLQAKETGHEGTPPSHMCNECKSFLASHPKKAISCEKCQSQIAWSPELQLKTKLGLMKEPTLCGSCRSGPSSRNSVERGPTSAK